MRWVVLVAALCTACSSLDKVEVDSPAVVGMTAAGDTTSGRAATAAVTVHGIAPLRSGMTLAEARAVLPAFAFPARANTAGCEYASSTGLPAGIRVMVDNGTVARVEVDSASVPTAEGARVGDSESRVKSIYGARVSVSPHKYTDGHYLTVTPASQADSAYRLIFETDGSRVLRYRAGLLPQVGWVEGCS